MSDIIIVSPKPKRSDWNGEIINCLSVVPRSVSVECREATFKDDHMGDVLVVWHKKEVSSETLKLLHVTLLECKHWVDVTLKQLPPAMV